MSAINPTIVVAHVIAQQVFVLRRRLPPSSSAAANPAKICH
jgi:hypothetical protein